MALTTACERLTYAETRLKEKGWIKHDFRSCVTEDGVTARDLSGPACLVGSLIEDEELKDFLKHGQSAVPGLCDAIYFLGFAFNFQAWDWNDSKERTIEEVQQRVHDARQKTCPKGEES